MTPTIATLAPIPMASVRTMNAVGPGARRSWRRARRRSIVSRQRSFVFDTGWRSGLPVRLFARLVHSSIQFISNHRPEYQNEIGVLVPHAPGPNRGPAVDADHESRRDWHGGGVANQECAQPCLRKRPE